MMITRKILRCRIGHIGDKKKELEHALEDLETTIAKAEEGIAALASEIAALEDGIKSRTRWS